MINSACPKRVSAIAFTPGPDKPQIIIADKTGDIYALPVIKTSESEVTTISVGDHADSAQAGPYGPIFGHYGVVTDIDVHKKGLRILSGDRDGRIKISRWPDGWIMEGTGYYGSQGVTRVAWIGDRVIAGGWEGKIVMWGESGGDVLSQVELVNGSTANTSCTDCIITSLTLRESDGLIAAVWGDGNLELLAVVGDRLEKCTCTGYTEICSRVTEVFWNIDGYLFLSRDCKPFVIVLSISQSTDGKKVTMAKADDAFKWVQTASFEPQVAKAELTTPLERFSLLRKREFQENWKGKGIKKRRKTSGNVVHSQEK